MKNTNRWITAIEEQYFLLAVTNKVIAGFGSIKDGDYLDFLFVNKDYRGKGIAKRLLAELEEEAVRCGKLQISAYVSKTAKGLFLKNGFRLIRDNVVERANVKIDNYYMEKRLPNKQ